MKIYRTIFVVSAPFLDAQNIIEVEEAFDKYLAKIEKSSLLPVDFEQVKYISSGFGILMKTLSPDFLHRLLCLRLKTPIVEVLNLLGLLEMDRFDLIKDEQCPACNGVFDYNNYRCKDCGPFKTEIFKWRQS